MSITEKADKEKEVNGFSKDTITSGKSSNGTTSIFTSVNSLQFLQINEFQDEYHRNKPDCCKCSTILMSSLMPLWNKKSTIILVFICVVVAISFTAPIIIYGVNSDRRSKGDNNFMMLINFDPDNCIEANDSQEVNNNILISSLYNDQCLEYNGICAEYLSQLNNDGSFFTLIRHGASEGTIKQFILDIIPLGSQQCRDNILPFLCQYIYPPCDITNNDTVNFISQTECSNIRDAVCSVEWNTVKNLPLVRNLLPNCESFDDNDGNDTLIIEPQSLQCDYQFKEFCGLCLPLCRKFSQYEDDSEFKQKIITIFAAAVAFIGGLLVFIVSIYKWRKMLDFPSIHVVYNTICAFVIASLVLITYIGGESELYCSHEALNVAFNNPPAYCQITGFVFQWALVLMAAFWLLHIIHMFIKIVFPLWCRKLDEKQTKITVHVVEAVGAFILCGLPPVAYISASKYSFGRFPPLICVPSKDVYFYTVCVPMCILIGTGVILTVIMFWMLHKRQQLFVRRNSKYLKYFISFSVPEVKILILSCYFIIFGIIALINFSISIRDSDILVDKLFAYFVCQARGTNNNNTCYEEYDKLKMILRTNLNIATYFLMGLVPWLNLVFAIQVRQVKKRVLSCFIN